MSRHMTSTASLGPWLRSDSGLDHAPVWTMFERMHGRGTR